MPKSRFYGCAGLYWVTAALLLVAGCGSDVPTDNVRAYRTPQDVHSAANAAMDRGDYATWVDCFTPSCQAQQVETILAVYATESAGEATAKPGEGAGAGPRLEDRRQIEEFRQFLEKRGIAEHKRREKETISQFAARIAASIKDKRGFLIAFLQWYRPKGAPADVRGKLTDLTINGDTAQGRLDVGKDPAADSGMAQIVEFRYLAGSWRLDSIIAY